MNPSTDISNEINAVINYKSYDTKQYESTTSNLLNANKSENKNLLDNLPMNISQEKTIAPTEESKGNVKMEGDNVNDSNESQKIKKKKIHNIFDDDDDNIDDNYLDNVDQPPNSNQPESFCANLSNVNYGLSQNANSDFIKSINIDNNFKTTLTKNNSNSNKKLSNLSNQDDQ